MTAVLPEQVDWVILDRVTHGEPVRERIPVADRVAYVRAFRAAGVTNVAAAKALRVNTQTMCALLREAGL